MRQVRCEQCGAQTKMNEAGVLFGRTLCKACFEAEAATHPPDDVNEGTAAALVDPTVCRQCGRDNGSLELSLTAGVPLCEDCRGALVRRPFPMWVKAATLAVLILAGVSLARNFRYFQAYVGIQRAEREYKAMRHQAAYEQLAAAAKHVPEDKEIAQRVVLYHAHALADEGDFQRAHDLYVSATGANPKDPVAARNVQYLSAMRYTQQARVAQKAKEFAKADGLFQEALNRLPPDGKESVSVEKDLCRADDLLDQDRDAEAVVILRQLKARMPSLDWLDEQILSVEAGAAFNAKDYDGFLAKSRERRRMDPNSPSAIGSVASALACKYAVTGEESFKAEALGTLQEARRLATGDANSFTEYEERILHRINTRQIINKKEYDRLYRNKGADTRPTTGAGTRAKEDPNR